MQKLTANDPETKSPDIVADEPRPLKALFPELVTEGRRCGRESDVLKQLVGDQTVTDAEEKYGLNWHGKRRARQLALTPSHRHPAALPGRQRGLGHHAEPHDRGRQPRSPEAPPEVLRRKVKLIYIDPPYNTGKDFVYPDDFQDNIKNYLELTGQVEGGRKISSNTEASGGFTPTG